MRLVTNQVDFIKFCIVGGINTLISLVVFKIIIDLDMHYMYASVGGYLSGLANGLILSSKFVFKKELNLSIGVKFVAVYLSALGINLMNMYIFTEIIGFIPIISQVIAIAINVVYNYILNKFWSFK